ncbi:class A beta-lactamase, subclass A2 [Pedobacter cryoconitis]|uniref:beta-lactamase n=1 Tax=Pedobacter cryoconitis TaxID=188932 RepID=A0A7X0JA58_9SPHI|nr:class A beta-lactamase, subclass A2 [Pedobacter cryoconitis]MBB6502601.1 beta-lactamase class A [Pedobacter cryoconitis]
MIKFKILRPILLTLLLIPQIIFAQHSPQSSLQLQEKIKHIIDTAGGKIGVGVQGIDFKDGFIINGNHGYPMMSVFKFPLAFAILQKVDKGELKLSQKFHMPKEKLDTNTWSPMVKDFPNQDLDMTLADLLTYTVSKSDNNACDFLYTQVAGGPAAVNKYLHDAGVKDISIVYTEGEMEKDWTLQYKNWCKPAASLQLLQLLYHQKLLSKSSNDFLIQIMRELPDWGKRITTLLPNDTEFIHKTGASGVNKQGIMAAFNDIGIVTLPNGKHLAISVFVSDFKAPKERATNVIAVISKEIWDYYK